MVWWKKRKGEKGGRIDRGLHDRRRKKVDGENWQGSTVSRAIISSSKFDDIIRAPDRHNNCRPPPPFKARNGGHFHVPSSACTSRLSIGKIGYCENPRWLYVRVRSTFESVQEKDIYIYIYWDFSLGIGEHWFVILEFVRVGGRSIFIIVFLIRKKKDRLESIFFFNW